jgi:hypothetical protein
MSHNIALVNITDGTVHGHKAGCADLTRGALRRHADEAWTFEVEDKADAWFNYNSDFLSEGGEDNAYEIQWAPCAKHVPEGDNHARYEAAFGEEHTPVAYQEEVVTHEPVVTKKVGAKWTYIYVDGTLVAEIRNDQAHLLAAV